MRSAAARYWISQVPGWGIAFVVLAMAWSFLGLPGWAALAVGALLVIKDAALYPLSMRALRSAPHSGPAALVGAQGVAAGPIDPGGEGRVRIGPEVWRAQLAAGEGALADGAPVRVDDVRGLRVVVRATSPADDG